jgi:hypothetical protein
MSIVQTWNKPRVAILLVIVFSIGTALLFRLPFYRGYFFGDDSLLVNDALNPNGPHGLLPDLFLVGGGKWRPLSTPLLLQMARQFGNNLVPFQIVSSLLLVSTGILLGMLVYRLTQLSTPSILATVLVLSSPFTWLFQSWTYGVMESSALLCTVISVYFLVGIEDVKKHHQFKIWCGFTFLFFSTLIHERYIIVVFALFFFYLCLPKYTKRCDINARLFLLIPVFHLIMKGFILGINPITSGGETSNDTSLGLGVLSRILRGMQGVLGGLSGSGYYNSTDSFSLQMNQNAAPIVIPLGLACLILSSTVFATVITVRNRKTNHFEKSAGSKYGVALIGIVGISLLLPGSLVEERFEGRWIYGAQIFMFSALLIALNDFSVFRRLKYALSIPLFIVLLLVNWSYRSDSPAYFTYRNQVNVSLTLLEKLVPRENPWSLVVKPSDSNSPTDWQFAYGYSLQQLSNPPYSFSFGTCPTYKKKIPCYSVQLKR